MKITLINAPSLDVYGPDRIAAHSHFSLGLGYIAAVLRNGGHKVNILDPEAEGISEKEVIGRLKKFSPTVVGITSLTPTFPAALKIARIVRQAISALVVLGGAHANALPELILERHPEFDFIVYGEGEYTMLELCNAYDSQKNPEISAIKGLVYRENGDIKRTSPREFIKDVDALPFPARDLVNLNWYKPNDYKSCGRKSAVMITSRGCPFNCFHCASYLTMGRHFRAHSPEYVVDEMELLVRKYRVQHIFLKDDEFTANQKRVEDICKLILKHNLRFKWNCLSRVDTVSWELLKLMKKSGCFSIFFGIESGDEQILKNLRKAVDLNKARETLDMCNRLGFQTQCSFMLGNPGDAVETINKTIDFAIQLNPTIAMFFILTPYPGTKAYRVYLQGKGKHPDWSNFVLSNARPLIELDGLTKDDLRRLIRKAYMRFYLRPKQIYRIVKDIGSWQEFMAYTRGGVGLIKRVLTVNKKTR